MTLYPQLTAPPGGEPLSSLTAPAALPLARVLSIGIQIASDLARLHNRGLLHNGVRPEAIRYDSAGERAWLVDFADVTGGGAERAGMAPAALPLDRLLYASPEQSGRMERAPDHRSDIYALGVVLYELLTGAPPFQARSTLELIHAHIARRPAPPSDLKAEVPQPVSDIVMKMLAKTPEERYQSAAGLIADLELCRRQWSALRRVDAFTLGRRDLGASLPILPKLYGRESEAAKLRSALERACAADGGPPSMLLVAGYPGTGKTALIQEICKPFDRRKRYFVSGKFDQVVRGVPFGALIQALRSLVRQMLSESEAELDRWRRDLGEALGANGGVLAGVIPEIAFIIGEQEAPVRLGSVETLNRFQRVFQNFVASVARPANPLVIFLDDLQWADAATLSLLEPLLTSPDIRSLLLIGAYRDSELEGAHRLTRTLDALEAQGVELQRVALGSLRLGDLNELVRDTLHCESDEALPLARLVLEKTGGNPFFVVQFLKTLARDGHFSFDEAKGRWSYRIDAIAQTPLSDDVIDLMTRNILRLSSKSRYVLTLAACIGSRFDRVTLAMISEQSPQALSQDLEEAAAEGLIVPATRNDDGTGPVAPRGDEPAPAYDFLHDRVQQAAYAQIPEARKPMLHLRIGRLMLSRAQAAQVDQDLFGLVHHLNRGRSLIADAGERLELARLDLAAGHKAKSSTAHEAALDYFRSGLELLDEAHWQSDYALCFSLHLEAAESQYLCGRFEEAQQQFERLLAHAASDIDRARVFRLRSVQYEHMSRYADALASARDGLSLFGVSFPEAAADREMALAREIDHIANLIGGREIAALVELPAMTDPKILIVMNMLTDIWASAYILGDPVLARLISATMVRLSLVWGNVEESAYGYVTHAITVGPVLGDYRQAYEFGVLALAVNHRFDDSRRRAKIYQQFHAHVNFWCRPMASCVPYAREACRSGLESGDFLYAAYGAGTELWSAIVATQDLRQFVRDYAPSVVFIEKLKNRGFADSVKIILNWARALQGLTGGPLSLSNADLDENEYLRRYCDNPFFSTFHAVARLHVCCLLGTPAQALEAARHSGATVHHVPGTVWVVIHEFWNAIALAAAFANATPAQRRAWVAKIESTRAWFDVLADSCPDNFRCQSLILAAELERVEGRDLAAIERYEQAIEASARPGMIQQRALACELLARLRMQRGETQIAGLFMAEARACYARWGAAAKTALIDARFSGLSAGEATQAPQRPASALAASAPLPERPEPEGLDLYSVLKAAQAIAGEAGLDRLLVRLMRIAFENAGAQRGCLVLDQDGTSVVYAADAREEIEQEPRAFADAASDLPASLVNYVRRTSESIVLADASSDEHYGNDPYIARCGPRSAMCVAVQTQGRQVGVLYLENSALAGAFTSDRIRIVRLLATEAAIAVENTRLLEGLKREVDQHREAQRQLSAALAQVQRLKDDLEAENIYLRSDLIANVSHDLRTPLVSLRGYLEILATQGVDLSGPTQRSYVEIALRQSEYLATLIDELFELAKLDFKGLELVLERVQLAELAVDVLQKFQLAADRKGVGLRVAAPDAAPFVLADLSLIERVLDNLIGNALQHTPEGGSVSVSVGAESSGVVVRVTDTGSGIAPEDQALIFDRFYRVDKSRNRALGGAGLGLAIAKRIVELHGGTIGVESERMRGSCFYFRLPLGAKG